MTADPTPAPVGTSGRETSGVARDVFASCRRLVLFALLTPSLVALAVVAHLSLVGRAQQLDAMGSLVASAGLRSLAITPSGVEGRAGAGSHAAVVPRHDPLQPAWNLTPSERELP